MSYKKMVIENSIAISRPELAAQWHPTKNGSLTPSTVTIGSGKKIWWLCSFGHAWYSYLKNRVKGSSCPYCAGRVATPENNLLVKYPSLAAEWHDLKNSPVKPQEVMTRSCTYYWWKCKNNHEWEAQVRYRVDGGKCPYCIGRRVTADKSLAVKYPEIAKQWHSTKNSDLKPTDFLPKSGKKVWWRCAKGHEWIAAISVRTKGAKCPFCSNRRACADNNLRILYPEIAAEWNHKKNGALSPVDVTPRSGQEVWWVCGCGHEWKAKVRKRVNGSGCLRCYRAKLSGRNKLSHSIESTSDADVQPLLSSNNLDERRETLEPDDIASINMRYQSILVDSISLIEDLRKQLAEMEEKLRTLENRDKQQHNDLQERLTKCTKEKTKLQKELNRVSLSYTEANDKSISNPQNAWTCHGVLVVKPEEISVAKIRKMLVDYSNRQYGNALISPNDEPELLEEKKTGDMDATICITPIKKTENYNTVKCLECGVELLSLGWHLKVSHGMNVTAYRKKFNLSADTALSVQSIKSLGNVSLHMLTKTPKLQSGNKFTI
jgi:hypothetical protein